MSGGKSLLAFLLLIAALIVVTVDDYGVSWDESFRWQGGETKREYYGALLAGDSHRAGEIRAKSDHYPGLFDLSLALIRHVAPGDDILISHFWQALFGFIGIAGAIALGFALGGSWAGLAAGLLLAIFPRYWGHMFINPKDIPFAATYAWAIWALVRSLKGKPFAGWRSAVLFGGLAGCCLAVRIGAWSCFAMPACLRWSSWPMKCAQLGDGRGSVFDSWQDGSRWPPGQRH